MQLGKPKSLSQVCCVQLCTLRHRSTSHDDCGTLYAELRFCRVAVQALVPAASERKAKAARHALHDCVFVVGTGGAACRFRDRPGGQTAPSTL
jgi:hypothetical protein